MIVVCKYELHVFLLAENIYVSATVTRYPIYL